MKKIIFLITIVSTLQAKAQEDYTVHLNDTSFKISLEKNYEVVIRGEKIILNLVANDTLNYNDDLFSFKYVKDYKVSKTTFSGIDQISILTAEGSGFMIQKYSTINPTGFNEIILKEMTKESINYGYKEVRTNYKKTLKSGQIIDITKAVLTYNDDTNVYEVTTIGKKDSGILVVAIKTSRHSEQGDKINELLWQSLIVK